MKSYYLNRQIFTLLFIFGVVIFLSGFFTKLHAPLVEWDGEYILSAESVIRGQIPKLAGQPPLYIYLLAFWFKFFGPKALIARLINASIVLLTAFIIYKTVKYSK